MILRKHLRLSVLAVCAALAGCGVLRNVPATSAPDATTSEGQIRPNARPEALNTTVVAPPPDARTVEDFDTTTTAEREAAASVSEGGEQALGSTIISLGDPARPGFWIETPLVKAAGTGRVLLPDTGKSAQVDLIPMDGPATAGSRLSLPAMRLIEAPLTGLVEVQVFSGG